jgi:rabenosyn-5
MATPSSATPPPPSQARVRRVFGSLSPSPQTRPPARSDSRSPSRPPLLPTSASSQSLDQLSLSGTDDDRDSPAPLTCPICNEDMITLLQLNRHLDDVHREVEEVQKETVKSWFKKRMIKAKSLPPVVALNQKLGKAEPFERNGELPVAVPGKPAGVVEVATVSDEIVTKKHWQQETGNDFCSEPSCGKFLNNKNGHINCKT